MTKIDLGLKPKGIALLNSANSSPTNFEKQQNRWLVKQESKISHHAKQQPSEGPL